MNQELTKPVTAFSVPGCVFERTGLRILNGMSIDEWMQLGSMLRDVESGSQWWIGDWFNYGEDNLSVKYDQALDATAYENRGSLRNIAYVARNVDITERREDLSFTHHQEVVAMEKEERQRILEEAAKKGWTIKQTRAAVQSYKRLKDSPLIDLPDGCRVVSDLQELIDDGEVFSTVYADPPWRYGNQGTRAATDNHYTTMTVDEICALPVAQVADTNAHLHLWTTNAFLFEAKRVIEAWGFEYKSCFVWCKKQMGIGNYWRVSHEFLLLGIRGSLSFQNRAQMSWAEIERGEHSEKPEEIRRKVELVSPGPYLEMFGRITRPGWTVFGNEVWNPADQPKMQAINGPLFGG